MSLNYDLTTIKNADSLCWIADDPSKPKSEDNTRMSPITEGLIMHTMTIDLGEITEKNLKEVLIRSRIATEVYGSPLNEIKDGKIVGRDYTAEEVRSHIGLSTNVSNKSRAYFLNKMKQRLECNAIRSVEDELAKMEVSA